LATLALTVAACAVATTTADSANVGRSAPVVLSDHRPGSINAVRTPCPWVALTFDDGPDPVVTPTVLDTLAEFEAHATFFVLGPAVTSHPDLTRRLAAAGHSVANHTWSHHNLVDRTSADVRSELDRTAAAITSVGVAPVSELRPPRGHLDDSASLDARLHGYQVISWNTGPDRLLKQKMPPEQAARAVVAPMGPGAIIVLHDGGPIGHRSVTVLRPLLEELRRVGLDAVAVDALIRSATTRTCALPTEPTLHASSG